MIKKRFVIVTWDTDELIYQMVQHENTECESAYGEKGLSAHKYLRECIMSCRLPGRRRLYNKRLQNIEGTIVLFDSMMHTEFVRWLISRNPKARVIFYYWNNEDGYRIYPDQLRDLGCELWSFNQGECIKWKMNYNPQFFCQNFFEQNQYVAEQQPRYDLVFIGRDKGRSREIQQTFSGTEGIRLFCYLVCDNIYDMRRPGLHPPLSYLDFLRLEMQGKAILDWTVSENAGLSLRVMEALFFGKKLVTNNRHIREYDFYHPDNIFVIGTDELGGMKEFLERPLKKTDEMLADKYAFPNWKQRFYMENGDECSV